jgi:fatty acid desaturase
MATVYQINKGVSKPIVFKGLKAQYIAYLAIGLVLLLLSFAILYISGLSLLVVLPVILILGGALFMVTFRLSHRFGEHGLMKFIAKKALPKYLRFASRRIFTALKYPKTNL